MKKFIICAAIAVAGVAAWAASDTNFFKADDAEALRCEWFADGQWVGCGFCFHDYCPAPDNFYCPWAKTKN